MAVMKAMGMESDQEIVQMVGRDPRYSSLLLPSLQVITALLLLSQVVFVKSCHWSTFFRNYFLQKNLFRF